MDEVELYVLAGSDVSPAPAVAFGDFCEAFELRRSDATVGKLQPDHLIVAALALTVDAVVESEDPESVLVYGARQVSFE